MKNLAAMVLVVALIVDVSVFAGVGFGSGALVLLSPSPPITTADYTQSNYTSTDGLYFSTSFAGCDVGTATCAAPLITSMTPGAQSTALTFQESISTASTCPHSSPAYENGKQYGGPDAYYSISFSPNPGTVNGSIDGVPFTTTSGTTYASNNASSTIFAFCLAGIGGAQALHYPTGFIFQHQLLLVGSYPTMKISVAFNVYGQFCDSSAPFTQNNHVCLDVANNFPLTAPSPPSGGFSGQAVASAYYQSAGASFVFVGQPFMNGGTLQISTTTGYDAGHYNVSIYRNGVLDTSFSPNPEHVADFSTGLTISWKIPANWAQNGSNNTVVVSLYTGLVNEQISQTTIINPLFAPVGPTVQVSDSSGGVYPGIGDSATLTIYANQSAHSGVPTQIWLWAYYLASGANAQVGGCGSQSITGACAAIKLPPQDIQQTGNGLIARFTFTVAPPVGFSAAIGWTVFSETGTNQTSPTSYGSIQIRPANCAPGQPCDPTTSGLTVWSYVGPVTLLLMPILVLLILMILLPDRRFLIAGIAVIVLLVAVAAIFWGDFQSAFTKGGTFG